jgi:hypothetical protein
MFGTTTVPAQFVSARVIPRKIKKQTFREKVSIILIVRNRGMGIAYR